MYLGARREFRNHPQTNGEYALLSWYCRKLADDRPFFCFDIGAMHADWTFAALEAAEEHGVKIHGCIFEASPTQAARIMKRIEAVDNAELELRELAASDKTGCAQFAVTGENTGSSTLVLDNAKSAETIEVNLTTIDAELARLGWGALDFVKVDTEGHDFSVIEGGYESLKAGAIGILQFEYNWRWLDSHHSIKDVFKLLSDVDYTVGKLTSEQVEYYYEWHPELDRYVETNFLLVRRDLLSWLPSTEFSFNKYGAPVDNRLQT